MKSDLRRINTQVQDLKKEGEFKKAEVLLEKVIKNHPSNIYIVNNLMEVCLNTRFDRSMGLFKKAINLGIADEFTYTIMINHFIRKDDSFSIDFYFRKAHANDKANCLMYNDVLQYYIDKGNVEDVLDLFDKIKNKLNSYSYLKVLSLLYKNEMYEKGMEYLNNISEEIKDVIEIKINKIEFNRKLKNYEESLNLITSINLSEVSLEVNTQIKTLEAYCLKDMGYVDKANELFVKLIKLTREEDPSYIRIICGYVFCKMYSPLEVDTLKKVLSDALNYERGNKFDVECALNYLNSQL